MATHGKLDMTIFPAHVSKCRMPPSTNCVFRSGKLVNTGSVNELSSLLGGMSYGDRMRRLGYKRVRVYNYRVENVVGAMKLSFCINLRQIKKDFILTTKWESTLFPGLKFDSQRVKGLVFILFGSGNAIATGMKSEDQLADAESELCSYQLQQYMLEPIQRPLVDTTLTTTTTTPRKTKKKKPNQFKVINHTKKKANFKASLRKGAFGAIDQPGNNNNNARPARIHANGATISKRKAIASSNHAHTSNANNNNNSEINKRKRPNTTAKSRANGIRYQAMPHFTFDE